MADPLPAESPERGAAGSRLLTITELPDRVGLKLAGEADVSAQAELHLALANLPANASTVHIDLAGLRFIDITCTRELMTLAVGHPGRHLVLHSPPATLRKMIGLVWPGSNVEIIMHSDLSALGWSALGWSALGWSALGWLTSPDMVAGRAPTRPSVRQ